MEATSSTHPEPDVPPPPWHVVPHLDGGHDGLPVVDPWSTSFLVVDPWSIDLLMVDPWSTTQIQQRSDRLHLAGDDSPSPIPSMEGGSICTLMAPPTHVSPLFPLSCLCSRFCGVATVYLICFSCCSFIVAIICFFVFQLLYLNVAAAFFEMLKYVSVTSISCCSSCFMLLQ
ncbi:hypothetical protein BDA96_05G140400 [Sorghum bicolor]|uniref:Uncharacterized protein n=2 Tax=Sorghum bicolor TaxID=4558 RepID=A0A1Z5RIL3_SORBI|nr:hypothetical protein BDA96_05G140400 [Sorghum bicolor]OQU83507.1 hypothetical protein SORBI_3005G128550 [Sorghum bicolor]